MLALGGRCLVLSNAFDLKQGDLRVFGTALCGRCLSNLVHDFGKGTRELKPWSAALHLLAQRLPIGVPACQGLAALTGVGATRGARRGGFELPLGAQAPALAEAKVGEEGHCRRHRLEK
jgi:hypothetical protein